MAHPIRILVIDDDPVTRAVLRETFTKADDLELVGEAGTALDGIRLARAEKPDVVVLDNELPGAEHERAPMQGVEAIDYLKRGDSPPVVVFYSVSPRIETSARRSGADSFVFKSGGPGMLLAEIRRLGGSH